MKHTFFSALLALSVLILVSPSCKKRNVPKIPDPDLEKSEAQLDYEEAVTLMESGSEEDLAKALELLEEAAEHGSDSAQVAAGALFEYGKGTSADMGKAKEYYSKAAAQGNKEAKEKLHLLSISKSRLELPTDFPVPLNELMVWNGDTLSVPNGDASFHSSEKSVVLVDKDQQPVYVSFRAKEGKAATAPVKLDARETAVSLLLLSIPYGLTMENDRYQTYYREMLDGFPETDNLARAIEKSVARNGHFVYDDVKSQLDAVIRQVNKELGLDQIGRNPALLAPAKAQVNAPGPFQAPSANDASRQETRSTIAPQSLNKPTIAWGSSYFFGELYTKVDGDYTNGPNGREWKVTVMNEMPMYFYLDPGRLDEMDMNRDQMLRWRKANGLPTGFDVNNIVKAANLSTYFDIVGVNGMKDLKNALKTIRTDIENTIYAWKNGEHLDYNDKLFGKKITSIWMPIESDHDVLYISAMDRRPEMFVTGLYDIIIFPVIAQCLEQYGDEVYGKLLSSYIVSTDITEIIAMSQSLRGLQLDTFKDLFIKSIDKWAATTLQETIAEIIDEDLMTLTAYGSLQAAGALFPGMASEKLVDSAVKELKAFLTVAKWAQIACNSAVWALYQCSTDSYSVGFSVTADGVPDDLEAVDLGLSVKWSSCNVGASSRWGGGRLYAWGETFEKSNYAWDYYKWGSGPGAITKYGGDGLTVLDSADDAATQEWGKPWRMPTAEEYQELIDNCTFKLYSYNGQRGYLATSRINGQYLFIPSAGSSELAPVTDGAYWTSSLHEGNDAYARTFEIRTGTQSGDYWMSQFRRNSGRSVRGVQDNGTAKVKVSRTFLEFPDTQVGETAEIDWTITNVGNARLNVTSLTVPEGFSTDFSTWVAKVLDPNESQVIKVYFTPTEAKSYTGKMVFKSNAVNAQDYGFPIFGKGVKASVPNGAVDMGLVYTRKDGSKYRLYWAKCNLGAGAQEEYGDYYAWGETEPKSDYSRETYKWMQGDKVTKYCILYYKDAWAGPGSPDNKETLDLEDDAAHVKLGGKWRMPTLSETNDLYEACEVYFAKRNGIKGVEFKSKINGEIIFVPAAGYRDGTELMNCYQDKKSCYTYFLSSTLCDATYAWACAFNYYESGAGFTDEGLVYGQRNFPRWQGVPIRPVSE